MEAADLSFSPTPRPIRTLCTQKYLVATAVLIAATVWVIIANKPDSTPTISVSTTPVASSGPEPLPSFSPDPSLEVSNPYYDPKGIVSIDSQHNETPSLTPIPDLNALFESCVVAESSLRLARHNLLSSQRSDRPLSNNPVASTYSEAWLIIRGDRERTLQVRTVSLLRNQNLTLDTMKSLLSSLVIAWPAENMKPIDSIPILEATMRTCRVGKALITLITESDSTADYTADSARFVSSLASAELLLMHCNSAIGLFRQAENPEPHMSY